MRPLRDVAILLHRGRPPAECLPSTDLRQATSWLEDLLRELARLHEKGAFHGNVGPDTVRIGPRGAKLTRVGDGLPPPEFRDPERERLVIKDARTADSAEPRNDIYGAGAVLFTLLDGGPPACGPASVFTRAVPPALAWVTARGMAEGSARYPDADTMRKDLERFRRLVVDRDPDSIRPDELPSYSGGVVRPASALKPFAVRRRRERKWMRTLFLWGLLLCLAGWAWPRGSEEEAASAPTASRVAAPSRRPGVAGVVSEWRERLAERLRAAGEELDPLDVTLLVVGDVSPPRDLGWPLHPSRTLAREVRAVLEGGGGADRVQATLLENAGADTLPAVLWLTKGPRPGTLRARLVYRGITWEQQVEPPR